MRLLLDTHALLWFCEGNPALSAAARSAIRLTVCGEPDCIAKLKTLLLSSPSSADVR